MLGGTGSSTSQSTYLVGTVQAQTDSSNLFAVTSGVTGDEDDGREGSTTGIPLTIRYALDDSKLRKLGWKPEVNFDNELQSIIKYYKNKFIW